MRPKTLICTALLGLSVILKFWLIATLPIADEGADAAGYAEQINEGLPNFFPPGMGWIGQFLRDSGLSFRIGLEIAYLLACVLVVRALFDWPVRSWLALALFLFTSFNPAAEELFSHLWSDGPWMVLMLAGLSLFVFFMEAKPGLRLLWLVLSAACLSLATITRITLIPLAVTFLVWFIAALVLDRAKRRPASLPLTMILGVIVCVLAPRALDTAVSEHYSATYHFNGLSLPDSSEYREFWMTLQSVGDPTGDKFYPVDQARLDLIAQAGPVSKAFVEAMKTDTRYHSVSQEAFGKYDLALGWFHFVVFINTIPGGNLKQGFAMFRAVENEIATAGAENRIKVRSILPLPDCRLGIVASALPNVAWKQAAGIVEIPQTYAWNDLASPAFENSYFARAIGRSTVERSPLREAIGAFLCTMYRPIYFLMLPAFGLGLAAALFAAIRAWPKLPPLEPGTLGRQIFLVCGVIFFGWYAVFDASGLIPAPRFVILHNVLLPLLTVYYFAAAWRLLNGRFSIPDAPPPDRAGTSGRASSG